MGLLAVGFNKIVFCFPADSSREWFVNESKSLWGHRKRLQNWFPGPVKVQKGLHTTTSSQGSHTTLPKQPASDFIDPETMPHLGEGWRWKMSPFIKGKLNTSKDPQRGRYSQHAPVACVTQEIEEEQNLGSHYPV